MAAITYLRGDATRPDGDGPRIIAHVCNDRGAWGAGFSGAITRRWRRPEQEYRDWYVASMRNPASVLAFALGNTWFTPIGGGLWVASMVAQHGTRAPDNPKPIRYDALGACLAQVGRFAASPDTAVSVHMPRIGCGLAGGTWDRIEPLIVRNLAALGVEVTVYDLPERPAPENLGYDERTYWPTGYAALATAQDDEDRAFHAAMRERRRVRGED